MNGYRFSDVACQCYGRKADGQCRAVGYDVCISVVRICFAIKRQRHSKSCSVVNELLWILHFTLEPEIVVGTVRTLTKMLDCGFCFCDGSPKDWIVCHHREVT